MGGNSAPSPVRRAQLDGGGRPALKGPHSCISKSTAFALSSSPGCINCQVICI